MVQQQVFSYYLLITLLFCKQQNVYCSYHSTCQSIALSSLLPSPGGRLTVDNVFKLLKRTNKKWDWLAEEILWISDSKRHEVSQRYSTADDCLKESIRFWMKRCPYASYRWIVYALNYRGLTDTSEEVYDLLEPVQGENEQEVLSVQ